MDINNRDINPTDSINYYEQGTLNFENDIPDAREGLDIALSLYEAACEVGLGSNEDIDDASYLLLEKLKNQFATWFTDYKNYMVDNNQMQEWSQSIKPVMTVMNRYYGLIEGQAKDKVGIAGTSIPTLPPDVRQEVEDIMRNSNSSGRSYILDNPAMKKLTRSPEKSSERVDNILLSGRENIVMNLVEGYLTPYEREIIEAVMKCKQDGQVTQNGRIFCTVGQIYRGVRGGGDIRPTKEQKADLLNDLKALEASDRKIGFELVNAQTLFDEFEVEGGRLRILSFDEYWGKIRGQEEWLIMFDETPLLIMISEKLGMFESVSQEIKQVQEEYWTLKLDNGETIKGTTAECQKKMNKQKLTRDNIVESEKTLRTMVLSKNRIALRNVIISFVWSYMRARGANPPKAHSNKINYTDIFEQCSIGKTWQEKDRAKSSIHSILEHLKRHGVIQSWAEYTNLGETAASGIQFFIDSSNMIEVKN